MMPMDTRNATTADHLVSTLAEIATVLESPRDLPVRVRRVLTLLVKLVPYDRCALLIRGADEHTLIVVPEVTDHAALQRYLLASQQFLEGKGKRPDAVEEGARLALPVIGLEQIIGVLVVEHTDADAYGSQHLRLLSAVASQLGSYLTLARLHEETAQQATLLRERSDRLRDAARFREEFIGIIGHDLRDPVSAINMAAHLLSEPAVSNEHREALAARIMRTSRRMARMIDELLDFTRGRLGGGLAVQRAPSDLADVTRQVIDELTGMHPESQVVLTASGEMIGWWDAHRLAQMLSNLIANALRYRADGTAVRVEISGDERTACVEIHNQGDPIPEDELLTIFEPFRRASSAQSKSGEGLGLGLFIAQSIARAHEGNIKVRSAAHEGTTFMVRLPRGRETA